MTETIESIPRYGPVFAGPNVLRFSRAVRVPFFKPEMAAYAECCGQDGMSFGFLTALFWGRHLTPRGARVEIR